MGSHILYVPPTSQTNLTLTEILIYSMAESKPEVVACTEGSPEKPPELVSCTFDPADKPTLRGEAIPQVMKCTFEVPKYAEEQEKEKAPEKEKSQKDDKASDQK